MDKMYSLKDKDYYVFIMYENYLCTKSISYTVILRNNVMLSKTNNVGAYFVTDVNV